MNNELVVFTHNDLDALGCMLNIHHKFPQIKKKFFFTNYANIPLIVDEIILYMDQNNLKHLLIPDVSFSTDKPSFKRLYDKGYNITHIDHHLYPDGFWDEFPNMKVKWDKSKSATLLCYDYFKNDNKNLFLLSNIINSYDLWKIDSKLFQAGQDFNNYFWTVGIEWLYDEIINRGYKFPENYKSTVENYNIKSKEFIKKSKEKNLIFRSSKITICFVNDYFNDILIEEMNDGQEFVIGVNNYGIIKIRVNQKTSLSDDKINQIRLLTTGEPDIGHLHAFTYKMTDNPTHENIMQEINKVGNIIVNVANS